MRRFSLQIVDLEAEKSRLNLALTHARGETDPRHSERREELDKLSPDRLKQRILELENELGISTTTPLIADTVLPRNGSN